MKKNSVHLKLMTVGVLTLCFSFIAAGAVLLQNFQQILSAWGDDLQMTVYIDQNQSVDDQTRITNKILNYAGVEKVQFVSQQESIQQFEGQMASYAPDLLKDPELARLIPSSLQVKFKSAVQGAGQIQLMEKIHMGLKEEKGITEVSYGQDWVRKYTQVTEFFRGLVLTLGISLGAAALFVISNVIQTSISQRKSEIEVLELLGATTSMVRRPFLIEGAGLGFFAMALSLTVIWFLMQFILQHFAGSLTFLRLNHLISFLNIQTILFFLVLGPILGAAASFICLRRINTGWAAAERQIK